ncbi:hypothetical protein JZ751_019093 [Albula glossodonta]|uniref:Uncharacterized protein n=1 Tax=Albula glossodonta TaxID=121402 RepID=A0A8T2NQW1_9TELE|nr:hypothetical protein JZ751_019093 [Albula glossodonta]
MEAGHDIRSRKSESPGEFSRLKCGHRVPALGDESVNAAPTTSTRVFYISVGVCCAVIFLVAIILAVLHLHSMKRVEMDDSVSDSGSSQGLSQPSTQTTQYLRADTPNNATPVTNSLPGSAPILQIAAASFPNPGAPSHETKIYPSLRIEKNDLRSVTLLEAKAKVKDIAISRERVTLRDVLQEGTPTPLARPYGSAGWLAGDPTALNNNSQRGHPALALCQTSTGPPREPDKRVRSFLWVSELCEVQVLATGRGASQVPVAGHMAGWGEVLKITQQVPTSRTTAGLGGREADTNSLVTCRHSPYLNTQPGTFGRIFHGVLLDEKDPSKEKQVFVKTVKGRAENSHGLCQPLLLGEAPHFLLHPPQEQETVLLASPWADGRSCVQRLKRAFCRSRFPPCLRSAGDNDVDGELQTPRPTPQVSSVRPSMLNTSQARQLITEQV